jgi:hypothetical protein
MEVLCRTVRHNTWTAGAILSLAQHVSNHWHTSCQLNQTVFIRRNISTLVCYNQRAVTKCTCSWRLTGSLHFVTNRLILRRLSPVLLHFFRYQRHFNADVRWNFVTAASVTVSVLQHGAVQLWLHLAAFCSDERRQERSASFTSSVRVVNAHSDIQNVLDFSRFMERAALAETVVFPFSVIVGQSRAAVCGHTAITATRCSEPSYTCRCSSHGGFRWPQRSATAMMKSMEKTVMSIRSW